MAKSLQEMESSLSRLNKENDSVNRDLQAHVRSIMSLGDSVEQRLQTLGRETGFIDTAMLKPQESALLSAKFSDVDTQELDKDEDDIDDIVG